MWHHAFSFVATLSLSLSLVSLPSSGVAFLFFFFVFFLSRQYIYPLVALAVELENSQSINTWVVPVIIKKIVIGVVHLSRVAETRTSDTVGSQILKALNI